MKGITHSKILYNFSYSPSTGLIILTIRKYTLKPKFLFLQHKQTYFWGFRKWKSHDTSICACAHLCLTLFDPLGYSLLGSSVHAIFQARTLEWVAMSSSRRSPQPRDRTHVSCVSCIQGSLLAEPSGKSMMPHLKCILLVIWFVTCGFCSVNWFLQSRFYPKY